MPGTRVKLGRTTAHRTALYRNLAESLIRYEQIKTTVAKAKGLKHFIDKLISRAKKNDLSAKRIIRKDIHSRDVFKKLFDVVVPRYAERTGGYVRLIRVGNRVSDNASMCVVKLIS